MGGIRGLRDGGLALSIFGLAKNLLVFMGAEFFKLLLLKVYRSIFSGVSGNRYALLVYVMMAVNLSASLRLAILSLVSG
ncbi:hypothetical protein V6N12_059078 [Hibiscus sabdariffa]|uniref:NADH:quinone oxidoreductase/Mrp antiporter membrane subunit domain-containing protein n=1 Tax=Hibiscus sabdariffa TaxID=183260 RepID=A0ABR2EW09_9ROSI